MVTINPYDKTALFASDLSQSMLVSDRESVQHLQGRKTQMSPMMPCIPMSATRASRVSYKITLNFYGRNLGSETAVSSLS